METPGGGPVAAGKTMSSWLVPGLVLLCAGMLAAHLYAEFWPNSRELFEAVGEHDRNAHYWLGLSMGRDLRSGHIGHFFYDIHKARTWPPLHAILVGIVLLIGGLDVRLAVLPSLFAWVGTVWLAFLVTRRAVPRGGNLAGGLAALLVLCSPALKAYATDIMIESMGACLSLAVLYGYLRLVQEPEKRNGWLLGVALSALFFCKYNYYMLLLATLLLGELVARWRWALELVRTHWQAWRPWLATQLREPLNYLIALSLLLLAVIHFIGPFEFQLGGKERSIRAGGTLMEIPYLLFLLRLGQWWWRQGGRAWAATLPAPVSPLIYGHIVPVALWFAWPQRLSYFLWYVASPHGANPDATLWRGLTYYWNCFVVDYSSSWLMAATTVVLAVVAVAARRWLKPGGQIVLAFVLIAIVLSARHPNQKSRCMHSWVAGSFVAAGMGLGFLVHGGAARSRLRPWLGATAAAGLGLALLPGVFERGHAPCGGPRDYHTGSLDVIDWYLPHLADVRQAAVISNIPLKFQAMWTALDCYGDRVKIETGQAARPGQDDPAGHLANWLATTANEKLVFVDIEPESPYWAPLPGWGPYEKLRELLPQQGRFVLEERREFPDYHCTVSVWKRTAHQ